MVASLASRGFLDDEGTLCGSTIGRGSRRVKGPSAGPLLDGGGGTLSRYIGNVHIWEDRTRGEFMTMTCKTSGLSQPEFSTLLNNGDYYEARTNVLEFYEIHNCCAFSKVGFHTPSRLKYSC